MRSINPVIHRPIVLLALSLLLLPCVAAAPATRPIAADYDRLNDPDPAVRRVAEENLMRLSGTELPALLEIVKNDPPTAAQIGPLRRAVIAAAVSSSPDQHAEGRGFLGISLGVVDLPGAGNARRMAVTVESRLAGFVGYRALEDGDVILEVREPRLTIRIDEPRRLQDAIISRPAGTRLTLVILRGGRLIDVPVTLDAVPESDNPQMPPDPDQFQAMQSARLNQANKYWEKNFAPLCPAGK